MALLLIFHLFSGDSAAAIRRFTEEEVCTLANWIVIGKVETRQSMWLDQGQTTIITKVTLSVDHVIAGNPGSTVSVITLGGTIGETTQFVGEEPAMPIDSMYLLLLNKPANSPPALIGGTFGARRLDPEAQLPTGQEKIEQWKQVCSEYL